MSGSFGIIFSSDNKKVLLTKRRDMPLWVLPGGGIEKGETQEEAVIREVFEETGYRVEVIRRTGEYFYPKKNKTNYLFLCKIIGGSKTLSNETSDIKEFVINEYPEMTHPHAVIYINDVLNEKNIVKRDLEGYGSVFFFKALLHPWFLIKFILRKIGLTWNT